MTAKPKLRWYQFSLRSLFILMTLVACACSWYAYEMNEAAKRRAVIEKIEKLGGFVRYYDPTDTTTPVEYRRGEPPKWYSWLRKLHGDQHLGNAVGFGVGRMVEPVTDAGMMDIAGLTELESITLCRSQITDAGLVYLKDLARLKRLTIVSPHITDAGLVHLQGLSKLERLSLYGTQVTDEGVRTLQEALPNCKISH
jgi:hypothetical protein